MLDNGARPAELPSFKAIIRRTDRAPKDSTLPFLSVPEEHIPREWAPAAALRHRVPVKDIALRFGIEDPRHQAMALAQAMAMTLKMAAARNDVSLLAHMAAETMVGVARTGPLNALD